MTTAHSSTEDPGEPISDGPGCAGCHSGNYDPQKAASPDADGVYPVEVSENGAFSEGMVGCSTCHYGGGTQHAAPRERRSRTPTSAGSAIRRYGNSKPPNDKYPLASPVPGGTINPQYPIGYKMLGEAGTTGWVDALPLTDLINVPQPAAPVAQNYYKLGEETLPWAARTHDGGALQYQEWAMEGHANALTQIKKFIPESVINQGKCLKCHSQDYRMAPDDAKPTAAEAKYGITCTSCHDPHEEGAQSRCVERAQPAAHDHPPGAVRRVPQRRSRYWRRQARQRSPSSDEGDDERHRRDRRPAGLAERSQGQVRAVSHAADGQGPFDRPRHRQPPPTTRSRSSSRTWRRKPSRPSAIAGAKRNMPYSACTTCHSRPKATRRPRSCRTRSTIARKPCTPGTTRSTAALTAAAKRLGFKSTAAANTAINKIKPTKKWSKGQRAFQKSFTNQYYIQSEGSWGIHNWDYARTVILKALEQARSVRR